MRIVSLLPSATELLLALTRRVDHPRASLVARSHECDFPRSTELAALPVLTAAAIPGWQSPTSSREIDAAVRARLAAQKSLYSLDAALLASLKPDLILTQDLCAVCSIDLHTVRAVAAQLQPEPRVLSLNPHTIEGVFDDLLRIGSAIEMEAKSIEIVANLREKMCRIEDFVPAFSHRPNVVFLEWTDPFFAGGHWTPQLIERAGAQHPLNPTVANESAGAAAGPIGQTLRAAGKSIQVPREALVAAQPEFIFIAPCGLSLQNAWDEGQRLIREEWFLNLTVSRGGSCRGVWCIDGNQMFNRPGPRLVEAFEFLVGVVQDRPELLRPEFPARALRV